jgi:hypothetical protein
VSRRLSNLWVYKLIPPRPTFDQDMNDEERAIMNGHVDYWGRLIEERGGIFVYGPVRDSAGSWGLGVIQADGEEEVRAILADEPALSSGLASCDLGKMLAAVVPD